MRRYSAKEVARATGVCVETVRRAWRRGELAVLRSPSGHFKTVPEPEVLRWMQARGLTGDGHGCIPVRIPSPPRQEPSAALPSGTASEPNPSVAAKPTKPDE